MSEVETHDVTEIEIQLGSIEGDPVRDPDCLHCVIIRALLAHRPEGRFSGDELITALATCVRDFALASNFEPLSTMEAFARFVAPRAYDLLKVFPLTAKIFPGWSDA